MIDRIALAESRGWDHKEVYKGIDAWRKLYARQPASTITLDEYFDMMQSSGLRPNMVGLRLGQFHLARYNDAGFYSVGNCRFVPQEKNQKERKEGYQKNPKFRKLMSALALKRQRIGCRVCGLECTPSMLARWHNDRCRAGDPASKI